MGQNLRKARTGKMHVSRLCSLPSNISWGCTVAINPMEFVIISTHMHKSDGDVCKYNMFKNNCSIFAEYPANIQIRYPNGAYDFINQILYIIHFDGLLICHQNKKWQTYHKCMGCHASIVYANKSIHIFAKHTHYIWNEQLYEMQIINNQIGSSNDGYIAALYIPNIKTILILFYIYRSRLDIWHGCETRDIWTRADTACRKYQDKNLSDIQIISCDFPINIQLLMVCNNKIIVANHRRCSLHYLNMETCQYDSPAILFYPGRAGMIAQSNIQNYVNMIVQCWVEQEISKYLSQAIPATILELVGNFYNSDTIYIHFLARSDTTEPPETKLHYCINLNEAHLMSQAGYKNLYR